MNKIISLAIVAFQVSIMSCNQKSDTVKISNNEAESRVDVLINDKLFTSYIYGTNIEHLKKPTLYPILTSAGKAVTRGFPIAPRPGERVDHPHHIGFWLNYGDVNGLDFWNNSDAIKPEQREHMGTILHTAIKKIEGNKLEVGAKWVDINNTKILDENTVFTFSVNGATRYIDRITTLTASDDTAFFHDNKEGMIAIRTARELEHASNKPIKLTDAHGNVTLVESTGNEVTTGNYVSSEGVWGKRAAWMILEGKIDSSEVALAIIDHPKNVGYPTYWHARGYGLFAANPLGQSIFSDGTETLNFTLAPKQSVVFRYRFVLKEGTLSKQEMQTIANDFIINN